MAACGWSHVLLLLACLVVVAITRSSSETPLTLENFAGGEQGTQEANLPVCSGEEFLTFDGTELFCRTPPVRRCRCPGEVGSGDLPLPPDGCPVFDPPTRGGFACLRLPEVIYCSVLCDDQFEFSTTPLNPYLCGTPTRLQWRDFTNVVYRELPRCTGFRHRSRPLHPEEFYLPSPCNELTDEQTSEISRNFHDLLFRYGCDDCDINDVFIQCPTVN